MNNSNTTTQKKSRRNERVNSRLLTTVCANIVEDGIRTLSKVAYGMIVRELSTRIVVHENMAMYSELNLVLHEISPDKYEANMIPDKGDCKDLSEDAVYYVNLGYKTFMRVQCIVSTEKSYETKKIIVTLYGPRRIYFRNQIINRVMNFVPKGMINISNIGYWGYRNPIPTQKFDHIVMDEDAKSRIINGLINWHNSQEWYEKHHLIHKIGVLLYGEPGTGKSSIVKAIADMFEASIHTVDARSLTQSSPVEILTRLRSTPGVNILLFEDLDLLLGKVSKRMVESSTTNMTSTTNDDEDADAEYTMNIFFQVLDGVYSAPNTIYIATTNCIEKLDKALIRPGRFDIQEELKYFQHDKALEYIKLMGYDESVLDILMKDEEYPIQPAKLQSMIMGYRASLKDA